MLSSEKGSSLAHCIPLFNRSRCKSVPALKRSITKDEAVEVAIKQNRGQEVVAFLGCHQVRMHLSNTQFPSSKRRHDECQHSRSNLRAPCVSACALCDGVFVSPSRELERRSGASRCQLTFQMDLWECFLADVVPQHVAIRMSLNWRPIIPCHLSSTSSKGIAPVPPQEEVYFTSLLPCSRFQ